MTLFDAVFIDQLHFDGPSVLIVDSKSSPTITLNPNISKLFSLSPSLSHVLDCARIFVE